MNQVWEQYIYKKDTLDLFGNASACLNMNGLAESGLD
jgi:hypothetical protein